MAQSTNNAARSNKPVHRNFDKKQSKSKNQHLGIRTEEEVKDDSLDRREEEQYRKQYPLREVVEAVRQEIEEDEY